MTLPGCWLEQWYWNPETEERQFVRLIGDYLDLGASKYVGQPGLLTFVISGDHPLASDIARDDKFLLYRRRPDGSPYLFNTYYVLDWEIWYTETTTRLKVICYDRLSLLGRFIVAYRAEIADRSLIQDLAEGALRGLVTYNATTAGIHIPGDPTSRLGDVPDDLWFTIELEANQNRGAAVKYPCQFDNLLEVMLELARLGNVDFDLVESADEEDRFTLRIGAPTLGTDRRTGAEPLEFSLANANMREPKLVVRNSTFKTTAFAGGEGAEDERAFEKVTSDYAAGLTGAPYYAEVFVDAQLGKADTTTIRSLGRRALLQEHARVVDLTFTVVQTDQSQFDDEYGLGDLGTATFAGYTTAVKVVGAILGYTPKQGNQEPLETLEVLTETYG